MCVRGGGGEVSPRGILAAYMMGGGGSNGGSYCEPDILHPKKYH